MLHSDNLSTDATRVRGRQPLVEAEPFDVALRRHRRVGLMGLPAVVVVAALSAPSASSVRLVTWVVVALSAGLAAQVVGRAHTRAAGDIGVRSTTTTVALWSGLWGAAVPWLGLPVDGAPHVLGLATLLGSASVLNLVASGASRALFVAGQIPMCGALAVGLLVRGGRLDTFISAGCAGLSLLAVVVHREIRRHAISSMVLGQANRQLAVELDHRARTDDLTGLLNRLAFTESVTGAGNETAEPFVAVVFADIDRFGVINNALGHECGDQLVLDVAGRIRACLDSVERSATVMLARTGGDEFGLVVRSTDRAVIDSVAEAVQRCFTPTFAVDGRSLRMTVSMGVALVDRHLDGPGDVLRHAASALGQAKRTGRARTVVFDNTSRLGVASRIDDEAELRRALDAGEIIAWFQPVVNLETLQIVGAEALARWEHPQRGTILPGGFIALAEDCGLIDTIGSEVRRHSLRLRGALAQLGVNPEFSIRVNVSGHQLVSGAGAAFTTMVSDAGVDAAGICFEVTESALAEDAQTAAGVLSHWRAAGHKVELDDFGTGYSSLSLVRRLPLDGVKIDRAFVHDMVADASGRSMVEVIIEMARRLGLSLTAEGVETPEQAQALRELGCPEAQGFLWSRAVEAERLAEMLFRGAPWNSAPLLGPLIALDDAFAATMHP